MRLLILKVGKRAMGGEVEATEDSETGFSFRGRIYDSCDCLNS